jgi:hypothetical protein
VQVFHGGLDVGMAHPLLHAPDVRLGDHPRPECVSEIVEAQRPQPAPSQRVSIPAVQRITIERQPGVANEDEVVIAHEPVPTTQPRQSPAY